MTEIQHPNMFAAYQQGYGFGNEIKKQRTAEQELAQLRGFAPGIMQGDPNALAAAGVINPKAAGEYDAVGVDIAKRATGAATYLMEAVKRGNPQEIEGRYQHVKPFLSKLGASQGKTAPEQFDPAMVPLMEQLIARSQGMGSATQNETPSQFRAMDMQARAAGHEPGSEGYKRAMAIGLGMEGRASGAAIQYKEVIGSDGKPRMVAYDPNEVGAQVVGSGETYGAHVGSTPMGTGGFGIAETDNYVKKIMGNAGPIDPNMSPEQIVEQLLPHVIKQESGGNPNAVSPKGAQGLMQVMPATGRDPGFGVRPMQGTSPQENVRFGREYLTAMMKRYPGRPDLALAAYNAGPGVADRFAQPTAQAGGVNPFVGRSKEDEAGQVTAAQEQAKINAELANYDQMTRLETERAGMKATAEAEAKSAAEMGAVVNKRTASATDSLGLLDVAERLVPISTGSKIGNIADSAAGMFGTATDGAQAIASLRTIAGQLVAKMPRMEGPQSNLDVEMYKQMAGDLANAETPRASRMAAIQTIRELNQKYAGVQTTQRVVKERRSGGPREITSQAQFDALPSGATYLEDGKQYRKP